MTAELGPQDGRLGSGAAPLIATVIAASVCEDDRTGRLSDATIFALRQSGLLGMGLPAAYGGPELAPIDAIAEIQSLAAINPSAAWYAAVSSAGSTAAWFLPENAVRQIWDRGSAVLVGGSGQVGGEAEPAEGGIRILSGRWSWGSGARDADWMQAGLTLTTGGTVTVFLPRDRGFVSAHDWDAVGLRASSSDTFHAVQGQKVPELFILRKEPDRPRTPLIDTALTRFSVVSYQSAMLAAVAIGNASGALDEFAALAARKTPATDSTTLSRSPDVWHRFGEALLCVTSASALLRDTVSSLTDEAEARTGLDPHRQAQARASFAAAADHSTRAVQLCFEMAGSSAIERSCPLERRLRDALVIKQHYYLSKRASTLLGKLSLENQLSDFERDYLHR